MSLSPPGAPLISLETAAAIIAGCCPSVRADELRHLGSGWDFDAFLTRDGWVFRFPRKPECGEQLDLERRVLEMAARALPPTVQVPRLEVVRQPSAFALPFGRYRYLDGLDATLLDPSLSPLAARDIGAALASIHSIPVSEAREVGVPESEFDELTENQWFKHSLDVALGLRGLDHTVDEAIDWVESVRLSIPTYDGRVRMTHNDLSPDHLLVDRNSGALTGIIDWTDAALGDPARDFVALVAWQGWQFTERAISAYSLPLDASFRQRLGFMARLLSVVWLANAYEERTDVAKHLRWVHNSSSAGMPR